MASTFYGVSIANSGLRNSKIGLLSTSNNVSNVKTPGYSRQVITQVAAGAAAMYNGSGIVGGGSDVTAIERERNWRLDQSYWAQNSTQTTWQAKSDTMSQIESIFGEPSDNGFTTVMTNFHDALENLSKSSDDPSMRTTVQSYGEAFCQYFHDASANLDAQREGVNQDVKNSVDQINSYAEQLASVNQAISQAKAGGAAANELQDQRDLLLDKLSGVTGIAVTKTAQNGDESNPVWAISIGEQTLVNGGNYNTLECVPGADGVFNLQWEKSGEAFVPKGGAIASQLELRDGDGNGNNYQGVLYYQEQLNVFARTFAQNFNALHEKGYGSDGSGGSTAVHPTDFFTFKDSSGAVSSEIFQTTYSSNYDNITAASISLSFDVKDDVAKIAAASANPTTTSGKSDNNNAKALAELLQSSDCMGSGKGTPQDALNAIVTTLGTNSAYAKRMADNQQSAVTAVAARRSSVSGVSTNEEASNLNMYQQAYDASAKVMTTWDDVYKTTLDLLNGD